MRRSTFRTSRIVVVASLCSLWAGVTLAQSTFSTLTGTVLDSSGAVLPGVTITVTNTRTRSARTVVTDSVGNYLLPAVGSLIGPNTKVFSMTIGKNFPIAGSSRMRFEAAFSNLFDTENFGLPNRNVRSAQFGLITGTQTVDQAAPRTVQFSLRYAF